MVASPVSQLPARGRPRNPEADRAILDAATHLLYERGFADLTIEDIASQAGVSKTTIYRRWSSKSRLVLEAFRTQFLASQPLPDTGTLADDLRAAMRSWVATVTKTATGRALVGLIASAQDDPALGRAWREDVVEPVRAQHRKMLERAAARGELSPGVDLDVLLDLFFGAAYHRYLNHHLPLDERFVEEVATMVVAAAHRR